MHRNCKSLQTMHWFGRSCKAQIFANVWWWYLGTMHYYDDTALLWWYLGTMHYYLLCSMISLEHCMHNYDDMWAPCIPLYSALWYLGLARTVQDISVYGFIPYIYSIYILYNRIHRIHRIYMEIWITSDLAHSGVILQLLKSWARIPNIDSPKNERLGSYAGSKTFETAQPCHCHFKGLKSLIQHA
jgi:hypothetical protein